MKRIISSLIVLSALFTMTSCGSSTKVVESPSPYVIQNIRNHEMTIDITRIYSYGQSNSGPSYTNVTGYPIVMKDGKISGTLPYRGQSNVGMFGGPEKVSIVFENSPMTVKEDFSKAEKGRYTLDIQAKAGTDDVYLSITFLGQGKCNISCKASNRSPVSYDGQMR